MKKIGLILLIVSVLSQQTLKAQDSKVTTGIVEFNSQNYEAALIAFNTALSDLSQIKEKNISKAFYYRAKTIMVLYKKEPTSKAHDPLVAYTDLKSAIKYDDGSWAEKIKSELFILNNFLLNAGINWLNAAYSSTEKNSSYTSSMAYLNASAEINPDYYLTYDLIAQCHLGLQDSPMALQFFETAIQKYNATPPEKPDFKQAYVYYRASIIHWYHFEDMDKALAMIQDGIAFLASSIVEGDETKDGYEAALEDLNRMELSIYMNMPDKIEEAISKFESAILENPDDYFVHVVLAGLYEKTDETKAIATYKKAIAIDPNQETAYFNLGALLNNRAVAINKQMNNPETDAIEYDKLGKELTEVFKLAMPYFEKVLELKPDSKDAMRPLLQIYIFLEMTEEYNSLKLKFDKL